MRCPLSYTGCQILQHLGTLRCCEGIACSGDSSKGQSEERKVWEKMACKHCMYEMEKLAVLLFNIWLNLGNPSPTLFLLFSPDVSPG